MKPMLASLELIAFADPLMLRLCVGLGGVHTGHSVLANPVARELGGRALLLELAQV